MKNLGMLLLMLTFAAAGARADEGMWTLDNLPLKQLQERYNFTPTPEWVAKVRLASVRFNDGGSGAFVSPNGLVITNHHVALGQLQKMSTEKKDYVKEGFFARRPADDWDFSISPLSTFRLLNARTLANGSACRAVSMSRWASFVW